VAVIEAGVSAQAGPGSTGSAVNARHHQVKTARTDSSRAAKRRSQPRTVSTGRPSSPAIPRQPAPAAFAASAAPTTAAVSDRRTSTNTGSNTCVTLQPVHRDRRGRIATGPARSRTARARACPHPASTAEQPGHVDPPEVSRCSASPASASTVTSSATAAATCLRLLTARRPDRPRSTSPAGALGEIVSGAF
jgi:hypothetical protein